LAGWILGTGEVEEGGRSFRDYRNYIHPQKELSHGINISAGDARTLWEIAKYATFLPDRA